MDRSISDRFGRVEGAVQVFGDWRPSVDASVEELRSEVSTLRKQEGAIEKMREEMTALRKSVSRVVLEAAPSMVAGILAQPLVSAATSSAGHPITGPVVGHHVESHHREFGSLTPLPVKGMLDFKSHPFPVCVVLFRVHRLLLLIIYLLVTSREFMIDIHSWVLNTPVASCRSSIFLCSLGRIPSSGSLTVKTTSSSILWSHTCGSRQQL